MTVPLGWTAEQLAALPAAIEIDDDAAPGVRSRTYSVEELLRLLDLPGSLEAGHPPESAPADRASVCRHESPAATDDGGKS